MSQLELIKQLREKTLAGMSDCKQALEEANWNVEEATNLVKAKGLQNISRNSGKAASEGRVCAELCSFNDCIKTGTCVEINCQTDFVSNSPDFATFSSTLIQCLSNFPNLELFDGSLKFEGTNAVLSPDPAKLQQMHQDLMATTKENVVIRRWARIDVYGDNKTIVQYTHSNNKIAVLLGLEAPSKEDLNNPLFKEFADNTAMQIAAMNPLALSKELLPNEEISRQRSIFETQLKEAGKPEASWPKIIEGKFQKWYREVCLLEQESVISSKMTISALADDLSVKLCSKPGQVKLINFVRFQVGDGIEAVKSELASEVAKLIGG